MKNYQEIPLRLCVDRDLLNEQTKTMINLHLNKIEHEYSNITLWAAVLTILFLVFSFYSVFKVDELVQQGTDGLKEIRQIKTQGEQTVEKLKTDGETLLTNTKTEIKTFIATQQLSMLESNKLFEEKKSDIERLCNESLTVLTTTKDNFDKQTKEVLLTFENEMKRLRLDQERELSKQQNEFKNLVMEINKFYTYLKEQKPADEQDSKEAKEEDQQ